MILEVLKALADPSRLRIVDILGHGEFTVQELTTILGMGQSRVSRHLKILAEAGVLEVKRQGTWAYYRLSEESFCRAILTVLDSRLEKLPDHRTDLDRLARILDGRRQRSREFFDQHARQWDRLAREVLPTADYRQSLLEVIPAAERLLEIGVGTGSLLFQLREKAAFIIGVDNSAAMLEQARQRLEGEGLSCVDLRLGEMSHLPLSDNAVAVAVLNMVMHHAAQPAAVLAEVARVLPLGGVVVIADLLRHDREWARERMADQWMGFEREDIASWLTAAGFTVESFRTIPGRNEELGVFISSARKTSTIERKGAVKMKKNDFKVRDLTLARWGRLEIDLAEVEMPGLMSLREEYRARAAAEGSTHHRFPAHDHPDCRTDRDTGCSRRRGPLGLLQHLLNPGSGRSGRRRRQGWYPRRAARVPVYAWKGETLTEYWWCTEQALSWPDGALPNMILDDGGDATMMVLQGAEWQQKSVPALDADDPEDWVELVGCLRDSIAEKRNDWVAMRDSIRGVTEETTTGVHRLYQMQKEGKLPFPAMNVNDSVTKSKFDNVYGCRHSLVDGIMRATDVMLSGKVAVVCGYGDVGKGCCQSLRGQGARVIVTEIDPICALQALMEGYQVSTLEDVVAEADIFITATGNRDVIRVEHMKKMKHNAIVGNIGHFDNEIDIAALGKVAGIRKVNIKNPREHGNQVDQWVFPDGHAVVVLAEGRLLNLGCATGHPSFVMSNSFSNQVIAQIELFGKKGQYENRVYVLPKHLDEKVARLHLGKLGGKLTLLTEKQAAYIGIPVTGPFKSDLYRY